MTNKKRKCWGLFLCHVLVAVIFSFLLVCPSLIAGQKKKSFQPVRTGSSDLAKLREEFIKANREYKSSLEKLIASYQRSVEKAEAHLAQSKDLYNQGLISRVELERSETAVAVTRDKVNGANQQLKSADDQIAAALVEAKANAQIRKFRLPKGGLVTTTAYVRYNGPANFALSEAWKVQKFFFDTFKKPLPVAVFGQGSIHDRWRLDHRNSMDISLHPDGLEGQALIDFLRKNGIPFLAFRSAIPGTATGPHIHIGRPSHRF